MTWTLITRTEHAKLKLSVEEPLSQEEFDALSAALRAWEPSMVSEGAQTVTRLLGDLEKPAGPHFVGDPVVKAEPMRDLPTLDELTKGNTDTFTGPQDSSVMGLRLYEGDVAVVTHSHNIVHLGTMHRWVKVPTHPVQPSWYECGHGGCNAHVTVEKSRA